MLQCERKRNCRPLRNALSGRVGGQLCLLDIGPGLAVVIGQEGRADAEHGITEAADIQDVAAARGLGGRVRLKGPRRPRTWVMSCKGR